MDQLEEELINLVDRGTIKYSALAKKVNCPLSTVHFRMKKLEEGGIIKLYKGDIDWKKAGFDLTAFILVNIDVNLLKAMHKTQDKLLKELLGVAYVKEGFIVTGEADLILKIMARNSEHLKEILFGHIDAKEGVVKTKTMIVLG